MFNLSGVMRPEHRKLLENLDFRPIYVHLQDNVNHYSILGAAPVAYKEEVVENAKATLHLDRAMGSMCGMGIGDTLGHMFEFLPAQGSVGPGSPHFDLGEKAFYGVYNKFGLRYGQWTDDSSMGLCMADSLIFRRGYDGGDMRARFWCWWNRGYNNAFRLDPTRSRSVGLGGNIEQSLKDLEKLRPGEKPAPSYGAANADAGNGSLMRFTPLAIFFHSASLPELYDYARRSSYTTHPGPVAAEACALLAHIIHRALNRPPGPVDTKQFLEEATAEFVKVSGLDEKSGPGYDELKWLVHGRPQRATEKCWAWRDETLDIDGTLKARGNSYNGYPVSAGYFGSYAPDGLAMALWSIYHSDNFDDAVVKSVNLLGDADSHGSITGQIAGALWGLSSVNTVFLDWLNTWDEHEFAARGILLHELGSERAALSTAKKQHR